MGITFSGTPGTFIVQSGSAASIPGGTSGSGGAGPVTQLSGNRTATAADNGTTFTNEGGSGGALYVVTIPSGLPIGTTFSIMSVQGTAVSQIRFVTTGTEFMYSSTSTSQIFNCNNIGGGGTMKKLQNNNWFFQAIAGNAGIV